MSTSVPEAKYHAFMDSVCGQRLTPDKAYRLANLYRHIDWYTPTQIRATVAAILDRTAERTA